MEQAEKAQPQAASGLEAAGVPKQDFQAVPDQPIPRRLGACQGPGVTPEIGQLLDDLLLQLGHRASDPGAPCWKSGHLSGRSRRQNPSGIRGSNPGMLEVTCLIGDIGSTAWWNQWHLMDNPATAMVMAMQPIAGPEVML